jgi:enamine deaminase RidA (YjgF/YER057c/UK114 family)
VTERRAISSGSTWEEQGGYSRAVVAGGHVYVAGTAPIMPGDADPPGDVEAQARRCLDIVGAALAQAGATFDDVVRTRIYAVRPEYIAQVLPIHGEAFRAARPACTGIVCGLADPRWLVEIEVEAVLPT